MTTYLDNGGHINEKISEIYNRCDDSVADCCWSYRLWEVYSTGFAK
ncbi:hypothetical protein GCM10008918_07640 [Lactobacillus kefiranofaciens subsp. kefiranofaciens]